MSSVQFEVDGAALGSAVTGAGPVYTLSWDTTTTTDGSHTLSALATDSAGHTATSTISTTVLNQLAISQRVQTTASLSVYGTPSSTGTVLGSQPAGALGTILSGPSSDGQNLWWQITYDNSPSGWTMATLLAPLPSLSIPTNSWITAQPTFIGAPNGGQLYPESWGNKGTYDPVTHRVIISDRWADPVRGYESIFANGLHAFDAVQNIWTVLKLNNWYAQANSDGGYTTLPLPANTTDPTPPDHHPLTSLEVVPQLNSVYVVNGINTNSLPNLSLLNTTWQFSLGTLSWTLDSSATTDPNYPPNIQDSPSGLIYDPVGQQLAYLVPSSCACNGTATYLFNLTANTWSIPAQDPSSLGVYVAGAGITYDSKRNLLMAYGGNAYVGDTNSSGTPYLWSYSIGQNKWTQLASAPVPAMAPAFAYDPKHDIFLAVVGNNTYIYNPNSNAWTQFPAALNRSMSIQTWQGVTYDPAYDLFVFEGGVQLAPLIALFRYDPNNPPQITLDTVPPTASITSPANGAVVSGTVTFSATASEVIPPNTDNTVGVIGLQFLLDGVPIAGAVAGPGPYSIPWNTTQASNGTHTLSVIAYDEVENTGTASISVTVNNPLAGPVITGVAATSITASSATINWTTNTASESQVAYGTTVGYGSLSALGTALVTTHSVILSGLAGSTTYHYQVQSRDANGNLSSSVDYTFTTVAAASTPLLLLHLDATEVSGTSNGSTVSPSTAPAGFTGTVAVNGTGSVNYTPAEVGNGVYFLNCCANTNNAHYKFTGAAIGNIFNMSQGQVSFYLVSRYSFAQRQASASSPRYAFDVRDASNHLFYFFTEVSSGSLIFTYSVGAGAQYYYVPSGTENTLFGSGTILNVTIIWDAGLAHLYLNNSLVQTSSYTPPTPNWTSASNFDLGAYEYLTYGAYDVSDDVIDEFTVSGPPPTGDTTPPTVSMTAPTNGATVSGAITVSANATDNVGVASVQFQLDGANLGSPQTGPGPSYSVTWNTATASNATHTLSAIATDAAGNAATSSVSVTVSNAVAPPVISAVSAGSITSSGATIGWTTSTPASSQVAYGLTSSYGSLTTLVPTLTTTHSVNLSGLAASTTYHYQVMSQDAEGNLVTSGDFTFTTISTSGPLLQLHLDATEVSGVTNGSIVTPSTGPAGFTGTVVVNGTGSVNYTPAEVGNGAYFLNCCTNTNAAHYKFTGATIGNIFNVSQGQVSFYLMSRYSFTQRQASASGARYAFDVRDASNHLFYFLTEVSSGRLLFSYTLGGVAQFYYVPAGTEDTLFGNGVILNVMIAWNGSTGGLYLNGTLVQSFSYTQPTPNWTAASNFDLGAYEYLTYGGYNVSDDVIDEFTVSGPPIVIDTTPPTVSMTAPTNGATVTGTITVSANATDNVGVASVQFQLDGASLGSPQTGPGPSYSVTWNTATASNGTHTLSAIATDAAGNTATSSVSVTVNNAVAPPVISAVSAGSITSSGATIGWTTSTPASSQVAYGLTSSYGSLTTLVPTLTTTHSVNLSGLAASTTYHYQVMSQDAEGNLVTSGDSTFTTISTSGPLLQLHLDATEVSGVTNGSIVTPSTGPAGFTGTVVVNGTGSVNYTPAEVGNGVYFLNCCTNTNAAHYKFTGATIGNIFNVSQGQVSFYLVSRYSFTQRQASASGARYAFDVRDASNHYFYFLTETLSGRLVFSYTVSGVAQFYYVPVGTEDTLFGNGAILSVTITWNGSTSGLYLNGTLVQSFSYTQPTPNWTAASNFDIGAYEYLTFGGYNVSDDVIDEFTVGPLQ
jgi:hypothetical protein